MSCRHPYFPPHFSALPLPPAAGKAYAPPAQARPHLKRETMLIKDAIELTKSCILFFHAVPEVQADVACAPKDDDGEICFGYYVTPEAWAGNPVLGRLRSFLKKNVGTDLRSLNAGFHKSFAAVRDGDARHLFAQQILHYFSTYGLESLGFEAQAFIPRERLALEPGAPVRIAVLRKMPMEELRSRLHAIALGRAPIPADAMPHFAAMLRLLGLARDWDPGQCRNKEIKMLLWDARGDCPAEGEEFLRFAVYKATGSLLLIKSPEAIASLKAHAADLKTDWFSLHPGLVAACAKVYYRYKPLFLALRANPLFRSPVNRMRKLAVKLKEPAHPGPLDLVTCGRTRDAGAILRELRKVSTARKVALINAIRRRRQGAAHAAYVIRNGKVWIGDQGAAPELAQEIEEACMEALLADLRPRVEGRSVFLPDNPDYAFPASPRQFTGFIPFNSVYRLPKSVLCGVHWENILVNGQESRTDLDLHLNSSTVNCGWHVQWSEECSVLRTEARVLFSGDMTDAPRRKGGASEVFFIGEGIRDATLLVNLNNYTANGACPFRLLLEGTSEEQISRASLVGRNLDMAIPLTIEGTSMCLGIIDCASDGGKRFVFASGAMARGIVSSYSGVSEGFAEHVRASASTCLTLREVLGRAGAKINDKDEDAGWDYNFSLQHASLDAFLRLLEDAAA